MIEPATSSWYAANQRHLTTALHDLRAYMEPDDRSVEANTNVLSSDTIGIDGPTALDALCDAFGLSPFERNVLLLCAGVELDASFAAMVASLQESGKAPTFGIALARLPDAHWSALTPDAPLRRWRLIEVGTAEYLVTSPLRIDERVLHYITGLNCSDEHLAGFVRPFRADGREPAPSHSAFADEIEAAWMEASSPMPVVQLIGSGVSGKRAVAAAAAGRLGRMLHVMPASVVPTAPHERDVLTRLWERECVLSRSVLLLDNEEAAVSQEDRLSHVRQFLEETQGPLLVAGRERLNLVHRPTISVEVSKPSTAEQRSLWSAHLGERAGMLNGTIDHLAGHFDLDADRIEAVCRQALVGGDGVAEDLEGRLWRACRSRARPQLRDLAESVVPRATWDDLVLPDLQMQMLREAALHVRHRMRVYETWGFAARSSRGLGISALFAGPSGTGKTMAAEVLANELGLDLYCIDLSRVVSKYIGDTEKNLGRVFDAAEEGGAILLFDEADALFGKRSEVKDSHDRYANIEVSYLLQRMESYRGLAILTTNLKNAIDDAFLRRLRFVVTFPFPALEQRAEIWRRIFPPETPTEGLDANSLARLNVTGGNIRNIALNAAFLAADEESHVQMAHVLRAARTEYAKLERPLTDAETRGWT